MDDLYACFCDLPEELKVLVLSHIEQIEPPHILSLSLDVWEALSLLRALQRTSYFEGAPSEFADNLVCLLDDRHVRSLEKERAMELIGVYSNRLCDYACGRNFEVLKWAHNELDLPWAPYPAGRMSDDVLVLRVLRESSSVLKRRWRQGAGPEGWDGVGMVDGGVAELELDEVSLTGAVPAEVGRLSALRKLSLPKNQLTSVPAEIGQLTSLESLNLSYNHLTSLPAEIGQLTSLEGLGLRDNLLTSVPAEIGQLRSLRWLSLFCNRLTSMPAKIGQLASLKWVNFSGNRLTSLPAEIGQLRSLRWLFLNDNRLTSVPAEIGQLALLERLDLDCNLLTSMPAEIGQLRVLRLLWLFNNQLTSEPAAIRKLRAAGCKVVLDYGVTDDE